MDNDQINSERPFAYGYIVTGADGHQYRAVALGSLGRIELLVRVALGPGGTERYTGPAGDLWAWCKARKLEYKPIQLYGKD